MGRMERLSPIVEVEHMSLKRPREGWALCSAFASANWASDWTRYPVKSPQSHLQHMI